MKYFKNISRHFSCGAISLFLLLPASPVLSDVYTDNDIEIVNDVRDTCTLNREYLDTNFAVTLQRSVIQGNNGQFDITFNLSEYDRDMPSNGCEYSLEIDSAIGGVSPSLINPSVDASGQVTATVNLGLSDTFWESKPHNGSVTISLYITVTGVEVPATV